MSDQKFKNFDAVLKSESGTLLAVGTASITPNRYITFESDFVPLYPIGTPMEIVRIHKGREVHRFVGKVYLSDKTLIRIIDVKDTLLTGCESVYCSNLDFSGVLHDSLAKKKSIFPKSKARKKGVLINIVEINDDSLVFTYDIDRPFETEQRLTMELSSPLPSITLPVIVESALMFGQNASYTCRYLGIDEADKEQLSGFLTTYVKENFKLFS